MNKVRGEQSLTIGEVSYSLVPTHEALARIEGRLDVGLLEVAQRFLSGKARHTDTAVILHQCSVSGGKELPYKQAYEFALEDFGAAVKVASALLLDRFGPPEPAAGKAEPTAP